VFESIHNIEVDRKNSLPIADLQTRYRRTGTPVVFGDLIHRWAATSRWTFDYLAQVVGGLEVPLYSNNPGVNSGLPHKPLMTTSLEHFINDLTLKDNDLRVSNLPLRLVPELESDFMVPRLGFEFESSLFTLGLGRAGSVEPMKQSSKITHTLQCHFGEPVTILLFPPSQTPFMYKVGFSKNSISARYTAEMKHGDAIYIPPGFWWCTAYQGAGVNLSLRAISGTFTQLFAEGATRMVNTLAQSLFYSQTGLQGFERRAQLRTNVWFLKR